MTDRERIEKLKRDITDLLVEFNEETKGYYVINSIGVVASEAEYPLDRHDVIIDGVDLNIQV